MKDTSLAEDIVSEVALKVWQKQASISERTLKGYFYTSIRNACISHIRKNKMVEGDVDDGDHVIDPVNVLEQMIETEVLHRLHAAMEKLPNQCRNVFVKMYIEGKSVAKTALEMNLSISTIKKHKQRGIKQLREQFIPIVLLVALSLFS